MKVSVVITLYNIEKYIKQCLDSVLSQTYKNLEVLLVDDCSTDNTMLIVSQYKDERIILLKHPHNMGAGQARKTGIEAATGDYVITVDGDDWLSEDFIEKLVANAEETHADIVSGGMTVVHNAEYQEINRFLPTISTGFKKFTDYGNKKIVFLANKLVKREMYDLVPYSTRRYCEDTPVILPLLYYANMVSYVDTQGYFYRQHEESLCHKVDMFEQALFKALCSKDMINFFADKGSDYQQLISRKEFVDYIRVLKAHGNPQYYIRYRSELGELMPSVLDMLEM